MKQNVITPWTERDAKRGNEEKLLRRRYQDYITGWRALRKASATFAGEGGMTKSKAQNEDNSYLREEKSQCNVHLPAVVKINMKLLPLLVFIFISFVACRKEKATLPPCIGQRLSGPPLCTDANVKEYRFQGMNVYVLDPGHCIADAAFDVWDANCNHIGFLGGLAGSSQINGIDFYANASYVATVWPR